MGEAYEALMADCASLLALAAEAAGNPMAGVPFKALARMQAMMGIRGAHLATAGPPANGILLIVLNPLV